jgi:hypothetical protein
VVRSTVVKARAQAKCASLMPSAGSIYMHVAAVHLFAGMLHYRGTWSEITAMSAMHAIGWPLFDYIILINRC